VQVEQPNGSRVEYSHPSRSSRRTRVRRDSNDCRCTPDRK
jgi:hypothetical protein